MTEGNTPPSVPEPAAPEAAPVEVPAAPVPEPIAPPAPEPIASPEPVPVVSADAIKEISEEVTEAVQEAIMQESPVVEPEPMPEPPKAVPASSSSTPTQPVPAAPQSSPPPPPVPQPKKSSKDRMLTVVRARKAERLEKIVALARERGETGVGSRRKAGPSKGEGGGPAENRSSDLSAGITNDEVQLLLGVSDSTAARYLKELAVHGRLTAIGSRARRRYVAV